MPRPLASMTPKCVHTSPRIPISPSTGLISPFKMAVYVQSSVFSHPFLLHSTFPLIITKVHIPAPEFLHKMNILKSFLGRSLPRHKMDILKSFLGHSLTGQPPSRRSKTTTGTSPSLVFFLREEKGTPYVRC
jgi:hypothetical protein